MFKKVLFLFIIIFNTAFFLYPKDSIQEVKQLVDLNSIYKKTKIDLEKGAIKGIVNSIGDEYAEFIDEKDMNDFKQQISGEFCGVGMVVSKSKKGLIVISVRKDSPAFKAEITEGDIIIEVDNVFVESKDLTEVVNKIKGKEGTKVILKIKRKNEYKVYELKREKIITKSVHSLTYKDMFIIKVDSFIQTTYDDFAKELKTYDKNYNKYPYLVIDLRNNPGGLLDSVVKITNLFLKKDDLIVSIKDGNDNLLQEFRSNNLETFKAVKLIVLVNKFSASASEIFAGAIKDHKIGTIVGEKTYGKGSVQEVFMLRSLKNTAVKMTIAKYYTPNGTCVDKIGIKSDIEIDLNQKEYHQLKELF